MRLPFTSTRLLAEPLQGVSRLSMLCGRALLSIAFLLLAVMPITEHLWTFDRFLRGGPDLELGLFALVSIFCLVVVLSRHRRQGIALLLSIRQLYRKPSPLLVRIGSVRATVVSNPLPSICLSIGSLPLQI